MDKERTGVPGTVERRSTPGADTGVPGETMQLRTGSPCEWPVSRRDFIKVASVATGAVAMGVSAVAEPPHVTGAMQALPLTITVNGERKQLSIDPRTSVLDLLREDLKLTGTKKGCDHGQCGACTVLAGSGSDARRINSCLALAIVHDGDEITTIEGLATGEQLHPVQTAFLEHDGYQCGYCTPGQILSAVALMAEVHAGTPSYVTADLGKPGPVELTVEEIKERMSGNICRCGAYPGIVAAVEQAYRQRPASATLEGDTHAAV